MSWSAVFLQNPFYRRRRFFVTHSRSGKWDPGKWNVWDLLDDSEPVATFGTRQDAREEAKRLNAQSTQEER